MTRVNTAWFISTLLLCVGMLGGGQSLIIPEELPSILSVIYSNIPPLKNGFDSRFGLGFRLGQHADVQLVTEIGPQVETKALGQSSEERRRHAQEPPSDDAQVQPFRPLKLKQPAEENTADNVPAPNTWLAKWHRAVTQQKQFQKRVYEPEER